MPAIVFLAQPKAMKLRQKLSYFFILGCLTVSCNNLSDFDENVINQALADSLIGLTQGGDVSIRLMVEGNLKVHATGETSKTNQFSGGSTTLLTGQPVIVSVFDEEGNETTNISCNEALFNTQNSHFEFTGNVIVRTLDRTLRSEHLIWNEARQKFETPGFVTITTPADSIAGVGFESDEDLLNYSLERVTGRFSLN